MKKAILSLISAVLLPLCVCADVAYTYAPADAAPFTYGYGKVEVYDVAVALDNPDFSGMSVTSVSVPLVPSPTGDVGALRIFVTRQLRTEIVDGRSVNVPDLSWDVEYPAVANAADGLCHLDFTSTAAGWPIPRPAAW